MNVLVTYIVQLINSDHPVRYTLSAVYIFFHSAVPDSSTSASLLLQISLLHTLPKSMTRLTPAHVIQKLFFLVSVFVFYYKRSFRRRSIILRARDKTLQTCWTATASPSLISNCDSGQKLRSGRKYMLAGELVLKAIYIYIHIHKKNKNNNSRKYNVFTITATAGKAHKIYIPIFFVLYYN